jgi:small subunit ribosomal protein S16
MPTTIRLQRTGRKKQASFRIVVSDAAESRDGPAIETIGLYQPRTHPSAIRLDAAAALNWLYEGAQPSQTVLSIFRKTGVWQKFQAGVTAESLDEQVITIGAPAGERGTSFRAKVAAEAQARRAVELKASEEAAAAAAAKAAEEAARAKAEAAEKEAEEAEEVEVEAAPEAEAEAAPEAEVEEAEVEAEAAEQELPAEEEAEEEVPEAEAAPEAEAEEAEVEPEAAEEEAAAGDEEAEQEK